jgi:acetylornithine/N-succinyldiaminopimelate aminotransferase
MPSSSAALMDTYARLDVAFVRGAGAWLEDTTGRRYLDALAGIAVCGLGHAHPQVSAAIAEQAATLVHTSNLYRIPLQETLATELAGIAGLERAFFCNSGAEANEAAIKIARRVGHARAVETPTVVVMDGSFHGRTLATLSATGNRRVQAGFEPLVQGFVRVPYGDLDAMERLARGASEVVAVLVEPIQGEGGVRLPPPGYLAGLRTLCDAHGWLLMLDEVQTGLGRTGRWFAFQHEGIVPDVLTLAKSLGNGVPIGACLARGEAARALAPGSHGTTYGGNPLACAAALATLRVLREERLPERAGVLGERIAAALCAALGSLPGVLEVRGRGLMLGVELDRPCAELVARGLAAGVLVNVTAERVLRLLPPLILGDAEADDLVTRVAGIVRAFLASPP